MGLHKKTKNHFKTYKNRRTSNKYRANEFYNKNVRKMATLQVQCAPGATRKNRFSCLSNKALLQLRDMWNKRHPDVRIITRQPKQIWEALNSHMSNTCHRESCWLKQKFVDGKLDHVLKNAYAPLAPKDWINKPNEWLTSVDILNVMKQYENPKVYPCYEFMGPSPIDYYVRISHGECVWPELCNFSLEEQMKRGKTKIGIIFNTDPHNKGGAHWISLFINIKKKFIYFYDSVGSEMPPETRKFIERVVEQGKQLSPPIVFDVWENKGIEHQKGNTECGVYSLFFIIHMLEDKITPAYLKTHIIDDKYMEKFRKIYFNESLE